MDPHQLEELIRRYQAGIATEQEKALIEQYFAQTESNKVDLNEEDRQRIAAEMQQVILQRIHQPARIFPWKRALRIAAAFALLLTIAAGAWFTLRKKPMPLAATSKNVEWLSYTTVKGERIKLRMADSSEIWLNSSSTIRYPRQFDSTIREIYLDQGEAFFQVTHNEHKPFIVHTPALDTRVLGTSFNIIATDSTEVSVFTGKVAVRQRSPEVELARLLPGARIVFDNDSRMFHKDDVDLAATAAWRLNTLIFRNATYEQIAEKLEAWYGVEIEFDGRVDTRCVFTAVYKNSSIEDVLQSLSRINAFKYTIDNKAITINPGVCK